MSTNNDDPKVIREEGSVKECLTEAERNAETRNVVDEAVNTLLEQSDKIESVLISVKAGDKVHAFIAGSPTHLAVLLHEANNAFLKQLKAAGLVVKRNDVH